MSFKKYILISWSRKNIVVPWRHQRLSSFLSITAWKIYTGNTWKNDDDCTDCTIIAFFQGRWTWVGSCLPNILGNCSLKKEKNWTERKNSYHNLFFCLSNPKSVLTPLNIKNSHIFHTRKKYCSCQIIALFIFGVWKWKRRTFLFSLLYPHKKQGDNIGLLPLIIIMFLP